MLSRLIVTVIVSLFSLAGASSAEKERYYQGRFCAGMALDLYFPDRTKPDCVSETHAIEVDFSEKWAESIGQALHYALWANELELLSGEQKAGIILVCRKKRDTCTNHVARAVRIIQSHSLPVTLWDCDIEDESLDACQLIE